MGKALGADLVMVVKPGLQGVGIGVDDQQIYPRGAWIVKAQELLGPAPNRHASKPVSVRHRTAAATSAQSLVTAENSG